jgi:4-aminobutyrate aminotransferase
MPEALSVPDLAMRDADSFFHQSSSSPVAAALGSVGGIWIETTDGRRLVDLHGNTTHHIGHAHPRLIDALKAQLDRLPFTPRRYTNEPAVLLAERLRSHWPGGPSRVLFATGGSDAIEIAIRLCRVATARPDVIAFEGSYHGHGHGSLSLSTARLDPRLGPPLPGVRHVMPYWQDAMRSLAEIEAALQSSAEGVACMVAEAIRSSCTVPPNGYWPEVRRLCDRHGAKLVFDEIPSGLGKTGRFFAFEHFGVVPDAAVLGKALGGGIVPIAAVIADAALNVAPELDIGHYTHEKNPLTARAALTTLDIIAEDGLVARAAELGEYALRRMSDLPRRHPLFRGGRGLGLLLAVELAGDDAPGLARRLAESAARRGVSTVTKPRGAIGFSPPLIISASEIDMTLDRIVDAALDLG